MPGPVVVEKDGHVATVVLNRPEKHNAIDLQMFAALAQAGTELAADTSVRAIVLEGAGASFCAGIDLSIFQHNDESVLVSKLVPGEESPANFFQRAAFVWREVPVPVICALHGSVFGGGLQIALGADLRFAAADCRLSVMEINWGLIPDMAISKTLTRLLAADRVKELSWTGRVFDAVEAYELGVVTAIHEDPSLAARGCADVIAARSPSAVRAIKRLFDDTEEMSTRDALQLEAKLQMSVLGGSHQKEAVAAKVANREPEFEEF